jgi:TetR/AcrR family transcriptional regulator, mexJK operon transcriptional repressor
MAPREEGRSVRKHKAIREAATTVFLTKGYVGTSMDEIAALAEVSKQTVYKHFSDKEKLFTEIVLATTDQVDGLLHRLADSPLEDMEAELAQLAQMMLTALMQPRVLQLRRLVISSADRFPELGRLWYERGFERVLGTLAGLFQRLAEQGRLRLSDPLLAAHHFTGMLMWIPMNRAMFGGDDHVSELDLEDYADAAVKAFLAAYRPALNPTG